MTERTPGPWIVTPEGIVTTIGGANQIAVCPSGKFKSAAEAQANAEFIAKAGNGSPSDEELIRGMTEMAERFTARMDGAGEQITRLKAIIGQIETTLLRDSAAKDQAGNIDKRNFVGQAILLCRKASKGAAR